MGGQPGKTHPRVEQPHIADTSLQRLKKQRGQTYTFAKYFKDRDAGHIINISSVLGTKIRETAGAYAGTKFAIEALSEALRIELSKTNVKIACIEPGLVKTELHREWVSHPSEIMDIPNPLSPEDIADMILYVLQQKDSVRIPKLMILPKDHVI